MRIYIFSMITVGLMVGCGSSKTLVYSYKAPNVEIDSIKDVELRLKGSLELKNHIRSKIPILIGDNKLLNHKIGSDTIMSIKELNEDTTKRGYEKSIRDYNYKINNKKNNHYLEYMEYCLDTTYSLTANLKLENINGTFLNRNFTSETSELICKNNKYEVREAFELKKKIKKHQKIKYDKKTKTKYQNNNIFIINNNYNQQQRRITPALIISNSIKRIYDIEPTNYHNFHNLLSKKLSNSIISSLVPKRVYYNVKIEEDIDIKMSSIDEDIFENTIEVLETNRSIYILESLLELEKKYPNSYAIKYNIGVYYEKNEDNIIALEYYLKAAHIKITDSVTKRIDRVQTNSYNINKIEKAISLH